MNQKKEIAVCEAYIKTLGSVQEYALIGSAAYLPNANDIDFVLLLDGGYTANAYAEVLCAKDGWKPCGDDYDIPPDGWVAIRRGNHNLILTNDPRFFDGYKRAMEVCKYLDVQSKDVRIAICRIVRDGKTTDQIGGDL